jgi:ferredoxin
MGKGKGKKEKAEVMTISHPKADPEKAINPATGTRHAPNSSQQLALSIIIENADEGKTVKEIKATLSKTRKENGAERDLDSGYFNFCVASHPEFFDVKTDGSVKVKKKPKVDAKAVKAMEEKEAKRKTLSEKSRKEKKEGKTKEKSVGKKDKKNKGKKNKGKEVLVK